MRLSESGAAARQTHSLFLVTTDSGLRTTTDLEKIEVREPVTEDNKALTKAKVILRTRYTFKREVHTLHGMTKHGGFGGIRN